MEGLLQNLLQLFWLFSPALNISKPNNQVSQIQFIEQAQGRTSIWASPVCALGETEHTGHLNVRCVLRHCIPNKGLHPCAAKAAILSRQTA